VGAVAGPASGPKWLVLAGLDRAMMQAGLVTGPRSGKRRLLVGASAGAWRMMAMASRCPQESHGTLLRGYAGQVFPRGVRSEEVTTAYRRMFTELLDDAEIDHLLNHSGVDLALHATRLKGSLPWRRRSVQAPAMFLAAMLNFLSRGGTNLLFQRVLLHTRPDSFTQKFEGMLVPLTRDNLFPAAMATGTVPFYMEPVRGIPSAPPGSYLDGGMADYHLRQSYLADGEGIVLFPHFQERIASNWFDRYVKRRRPLPAVLDNVLQVFPSPEFTASLPGGRLPERDDFFTFVDDPEERIRRWTEAAARSDELGERFLSDLESGRILQIVEPI
jgi:hypothetical protein